MPLNSKMQIELATKAIQDAMAFFVEEEASSEAEGRLAQTLVNTKVFYEREANAPSPLPYQVAFVDAWKKGDCYLQQLRKARMLAKMQEGAVGQHSIDRPPETTAAPTPEIVVEATDDILDVEDQPMVSTEQAHPETSPLVKWGLLAFVGYLGYRVVRGK